MTELKPPFSYNQQLKKIMDRGCYVRDCGFAKRVLKRVNYYRLTAYFLPFKNESGNYIPGTSFDTVYATYEFDRKLRALIFSTIEEIELSLRSQLAYYYSHKYGPDGYLNPENFSKRHNHIKFKNHLNKAIRNNITQPFVNHHMNKYNGIFPLWAIVELFTLGELSTFYADMFVSDKKEFAKNTYNANYKNLESWLVCITHIRNYCAHYSRLYYNLFPAIPATHRGYDLTLDRRLFSYLIILKIMQKNKKSWRLSFFIPLLALLEEYKDNISLEHMGFPQDWEKRLGNDLKLE